MYLNLKYANLPNTRLQVQVQDKIQEISQLNNKISDLNSEIGDLKSSIAARDGEVANLESQLQVRAAKC